MGGSTPPIGTQENRMHPTTIQQDFHQILAEGVWGGINGVGPGSNPMKVPNYIMCLQGFLRDNHIESVVDAGCSFWNIGGCIDWGEANYAGFDIYGPAIEYNKRFETGNIHFHCANIIEVDLPSAQLLIIKDVMMHWFNEEVLRFLPQLKKYRFVLLTNCEKHPVTPITSEVRDDFLQKSVHRWAPIDITTSPFNLCAPAIWGNPITRLIINTGL